MQDEKMNGVSVALKEYFERILSEREKQYDERFSSQQTQMETATKVINAKLEGMNEWRQQSKEREAHFITRDEHESFRKEIESLKLSRAELEGKASQMSVIIALLISVLGLIIGGAALLKDFIH
jgi:hypothetical protein